MFLKKCFMFPLSLAFVLGLGVAGCDTGDGFNGEPRNGNVDVDEDDDGLDDQDCEDCEDEDEDD